MVRLACLFLCIETFVEHLAKVYKGLLLDVSTMVPIIPLYQ